VGQRIKDIFPQLFTELDDFFRMTGQTKPAPPTGKGQQVLMVTVRTADTSETLRQVTALKFVSIGIVHFGYISIHNLGVIHLPETAHEWREMKVEDPELYMEEIPNMGDHGVDIGNLQRI
jgi:hypothetical protein